MSNTCPRFVQNAWKKDLCSNCFKSKEEHAVVLQTIKPLSLTPKKVTVAAAPAKGIIKSLMPGKKSHKRKVSFPKEVSHVSVNGLMLNAGHEGNFYDVHKFTSFTFLCLKSLQFKYFAVKF